MYNVNVEDIFNDFFMEKCTYHSSIQSTIKVTILKFWIATICHSYSLFLFSITFDYIYMYNILVSKTSDLKLKIYTWYTHNLHLFHVDRIELWEFYR